jgi:hypothetical protein
VFGTSERLFGYLVPSTWYQVPDAWYQAPRPAPLVGILCEGWLSASFSNLAPKHLILCASKFGCKSWAIICLDLDMLARPSEIGDSSNLPYIHVLCVRLDILTALLTCCLCGWVGAVFRTGVQLHSRGYIAMSRQTTLDWGTSWILTLLGKVPHSQQSSSNC